MCNFKGLNKWVNLLLQKIPDSSQVSFQYPAICGHMLTQISISKPVSKCLKRSYRKRGFGHQLCECEQVVNVVPNQDYQRGRYSMSNVSSLVVQVCCCNIVSYTMVNKVINSKLHHLQTNLTGYVKFRKTQEQKRSLSQDINIILRSYQCTKFQEKSLITDQSELI